MTLEVEFWQLVTLALAVIGAFAGLGKLFLVQFQRGIDKQFGAVEDRFRTLATDLASWRNLEREFLQFRAYLPEKYVRREDYIRGQTVIESKLDAISSELKAVQIQGATREG